MYCFICLYKVYEPTEYLNQLAMNTLKNIFKMINKINLAELLVCSERNSNGKKCKISSDKSVLSNECLLTDFSKVIEKKKYEKENIFIMSF